MIENITPSAVGCRNYDKDDRNAVITYKNGQTDTLSETYGYMKKKLDIIG